MLNQCFHAGLKETVEWAIFDQSTIAAIFILVFLCSAPCALIVLRFYQRRVERLMRSSSPSSHAADAPDPTLDYLPENANPLAPRPALSVEALQLAPKQHYRTLLRVLMLPVGAFAIVAGVMISFSPDSPGGSQPKTLMDWLGEGFASVIFAAVLSSPIFFLGIPHARFSKLFWRL